MDKQELIAMMAASVYPGIIALQNSVRREHGIPHGVLLSDVDLAGVTDADPIEASIGVAKELWLRVVRKGHTL